MQPKTALKALFIIFILVMIGVIIILNFPILDENKSGLSSKIEKPSKNKPEIESTEELNVEGTIVPSILEESPEKISERKKEAINELEKLKALRNFQNIEEDPPLD